MNTIYTRKNEPLYVGQIMQLKLLRKNLSNENDGSFQLLSKGTLNDHTR